MSLRAAQLPDSDPIMEHLEDQLAWYDRKSMENQRAYKRVKLLEILAAATIPFLAALGRPYLVMAAGGLGVLVTLLEGLLHLNQYQRNWINYRSICEALKHEKYTYLGKAGRYSNVPDSHALLAERIESLAPQEHAKWASVQQQGPEPQDGQSAGFGRQGQSSPSRHPSSHEIRVCLITQAGESHRIETPSDITTQDFIKEVAEGLNLPRSDVAGPMIVVILRQSFNELLQIGA